MNISWRWQDRLEYCWPKKALHQVMTANALGTVLTVCMDDSSMLMGKERVSGSIKINNFGALGLTSRSGTYVGFWCKPRTLPSGSCTAIMWTSLAQLQKIEIEWMSAITTKSFHVLCVFKETLQNHTFLRLQCSDHIDLTTTADY